GLRAALCGWVMALEHLLNEDLAVRRGVRLGGEVEAALRLHQSATSVQGPEEMVKARARGHEEQREFERGGVEVAAADGHGGPELVLRSRRFPLAHQVGEEVTPFERFVTTSGPD